MITNVLVILFVLFSITVIAISIAKVPKWRKVAFHVTDSINMGMSFGAIESQLVEKYGLTPHQAKLCVNHYGEYEWFEMQSFLHEEKD